jgi:hypothetical protein
MRNRLSIQGEVTFLFLWVGISALGWLLIPINTLYPDLKTYWEVIRRGLDYTVCGLVAGLIVGVGQSLILKQRLYPAKKWLVMTLLGDTFAWPIGLAISTLIPTVAFALQGDSFLPAWQPASVSFSPFPADLILGGWVVGLAQWTALRQLLPYRNPQLAALWVLGVWFSVGLGIFVALVGRTAPVNFNSGMLFDPALAIERMLIGGISGLVTALFLLFVIRQADQRFASMVSGT